MKGDILAVYLHKYRTIGLNHDTLAEYADFINVSTESLKARMRQVTGLDSNTPSKGLKNATKNTSAAFKLLTDVDDQRAHEDEVRYDMTEPNNPVILSHNRPENPRPSKYRDIEAPVKLRDYQLSADTTVTSEPLIKALPLASMPSFRVVWFRL